MYYQIAEGIEPYGEKRADYRAAVIAHTIVCCLSKRPPKFSNILKWFDFGAKKQQTTEDLELMFKQIKKINEK